MTAFLCICTFIASFLHSIHFGWLERYGVPSFNKEIAYINRLLRENYFLKNSQELSDEDLVRLYNGLSKLAHLNGRFSFFYSISILAAAVIYSRILWNDYYITFYLIAGGMIASLFYAFYAAFLTDAVTLNIRTKVNELLYMRKISNHYKNMSFSYYSLISGLILVASMTVIALFVLSPYHTIGSIIFFIVITFIALEIYNFSSLLQIKRSFAALNKAIRHLTAGDKGFLFVDFKIKELSLFSEAYNKAAEELYSKRKSLEETVKSRTEEIEKQKEELAALNESKDKLFTIIAHDLRNSFSALIGSSRILLEDYDALSEEDKLILINEISKATGKNYHLLENLLNWANFRTGSMKQNYEMINLREIAEECAGLQHAAAEKKNIQIENNIPSKASLWADRFMLGSVIRNLINNAVKFTDKGGSISIDYADTEEYCEISVRDTGAGMPEDIVSKLLGINTYFTTTGTEGERGSGLGLKMSKEFIEKMGGIMLIESKPNFGSKFTLRFPKNYYSI